MPNQYHGTVKKTYKWLLHLLKKSVSFIIYYEDVQQ